MNVLSVDTTGSSILLRATGFALCWIVVAGPEAGSWVIGAPSVALATWSSLKLMPQQQYQFRLIAALSFLGYFIRESLRGGWDVAMRTLYPRVRIQPGSSTYTSSLPQGLPLVLFTGCVSLLPGTLTQRTEKQELTLHLLDTSEPQLEQLKELEIHIANMLGIFLGTAHD